MLWQEQCPVPGWWSWFGSGEQLRVQMEEGHRAGDIVWLSQPSWLHQTPLYWWLSHPWVCRTCLCWKG